MLNRLTVSALLKTVILATSFCVVVGFSLNAWESWGRLQVASRISVIADASGLGDYLLFSAPRAGAIPGPTTLAQRNASTLTQVFHDPPWTPGGGAGSPRAPASTGVTVTTVDPCSSS